MQQLETRLLLASYGPDLGFGDEGVVPVGGDVAIEAIAGGKLLIIGTERIPPVPPDIDENGFMTTIARVNDDGSFDTSFGMNGKVNVGQTQSAVFAASRVYVTVPGIQFDELRAYTTDGQLDTSFSDDGRMPLPFLDPGGGTVSFVSGRLDRVRDDNDLLVRLTVDVRDSSNNTETFTQYARLNPDGTPDTSFSNDGFITFPVDGPNIFISSAAAGKFYRAADNAITRLQPDGETIDTSFANSGTLTFSNSRRTIFTLADGRILVLRALQSGLEPPFALFRLSANGSPDLSFGTNGSSELPNFSGQPFFEGSIAVDDEGRIAVTTVGRLYRFSADGQLEGYPFNGTIPASGAIDFDAQGRLLFGEIGRTTRYDQLDPVVVLPNERMLYVNAGNGSDVITVAAAGGNQIDVTFNGQLTSVSGANVDLLKVGLDAGDDQLTSTLNLPASVTGGAGDDTITTGAGDDIIDADRGENLINLGDGDDQVFAQDFRNTDHTTINGGNGNKLISMLFMGSITLTLGTGDNDITLSTTSGDDRITIAGGNNTITASGGHDIIEIGGNGANDIFIGNAGDADVTTGDGNDRIRILGRGSVFSNGGNDTLEIDASSTTGPINVSMGDGNDKFLMNRFADEEIAATVRGGPGNDIMQGGAGAQVFFGDEGDDTLVGGDGNNTIHGGEGNDSIRTGAGDDEIFGDQGSDSVKAGFGDDRVSGGAGRDHLWGQQGNDRISGTNHSDAIDGGPGNDTLIGLRGNDKLFGGDGLDLLDGGEDDDTIFARDGMTDMVFGGTGHDRGQIDNLFDIVDGVEEA